MLQITEVEDFKPIYHYHMSFQSPYFFPVDFSVWKRSFEADVDGEGRELFKELAVKAVYEENELLGFIQYGTTAFGFDSRGELSASVSHCVIRNLYFDRNSEDAGALLLGEALAAFASADRVYAFFHYFGMSCFARHGKLFEQHGHIDRFLKEQGFQTEHENVYYSTAVAAGASEVTVAAQPMTAGNQQYMDFLLDGSHAGGCEIHRLDGQTVYLRWIYVNAPLTGRGIGTKCMDALKTWLSQSGVTRLDTDTAVTNTVAQHFYEKIGFAREGITRSYYR